MSIMPNVAARVAQLTPGYAALLCFALGVLLVLAFAPFDIWPAIFVAIPLFYLLLESAPSRRAALVRGFFFGYGFYMAGTYWIANALLVDAAQFGWLVPLCVLGLTAIYALWFVLFGGLFWTLRTGRPLADLARFAVLWVAVEYAHSIGMFGFPWNLAGYVALASARVSQLAAVTGIYGLSFVVIMAALLPVLFLKDNIAWRVRERSVLAAFAVAIVLYAYGMARMPEAAVLSETRVRIVQANIPQAIKWTDEGRVESLKVHAKMSQLVTDAPLPPLIVWPESAFTFTLYPGSQWPLRLGSLLPSGGALITGAARGEGAGEDLKLWNSIVAIDGSGTIVATYDKHRLVPFGEFVPLRQFLPMEKITPGAVDFSRGPGPQTLHVAGHPSFSPLVCYEAIFPAITVDSRERPRWLLNVTNDAWYGNSPGPYQHFAMSRLRAIEQGLPLVRAANTGISAVIDPYGRILKRLPLNERGIIDQALPEPLSRTFYAHYGEWVSLLVLAAIWVVAAYAKDLPGLLGNRKK